VSTESVRKWRAANPGKSNEHARAATQRVRDWTDGIKVGRGGCYNCNEIDPRCLDFHHRDPSKKSFDIGSHATLSRKRVKVEIDKCDVICANCHRKLYGRSIQ